VIVAAAGFATLGLLGLAIVAVPIVVLMTRRAALRVAAQPGGRTLIPAEIDVVGEA